MLTKLIYLFTFIALTSCLIAEEAKDKKEILVIYNVSTHGHGQHRNTEVAKLIKHKIDTSKYADKINVTLSFKYPKDTSLVDKADLIIISSDGGAGHALITDKEDVTTNIKDLDQRLKDTKAGVIVIHWATHCPSVKKFGLCDASEANNKIFHRWIGAYYYWGKSGSWTDKFPVKELTVNKKHPVGNGLPEKFKLHDEYYWNFFTAEDDPRNHPCENVVFMHETMAGKKKQRIQSPYWLKTRDDGGRSVGMTSAHMYHTWANPHFFKTFTNSMFWSMNLEVPENGVDISTPTIEELKSFGKDATIFPEAKFFE